MRKQFRMPLNLQFFAEEAENNSQENQVESQEQQQQTTVEEPENKPKESEKLFTQAELDEIIAKRLERERKKQADLAEKLKRLEELEKAEEERRKAEMSEAERLKVEKEEAEKRAAELAEQAKKAEEAAKQRIINTEIRSVARALNANDPNDVLALLDKSNIEIDEDGNVKGVEEAVKALKESKPWMFKQVIGADASGGANPHKNPGISELAALEKEYAEIKEKARKNKKLFGRVIELGNKIAELKAKGRQ